MTGQYQYGAEFIAKRLDKWERRGKGWRACCPAHKDTNPSLDIDDGPNGPLFICRAGCKQDAIIAGLRDIGLSFDTVHEKKKSYGGKARSASKDKPPKVVATYDYVDESGKLLFQKVRYEPKGFSQRKPNGKGGWIKSLDGVPQVPFQLPQVLKAAAEKQTIFVVEGEKDVLNLAKLGFVATCNAGGAGKWPPELNQYFAGTSICIISDNDKAGRSHCKVVGEALQDFAASVEVLDFPGVPEKGDASDWINDGGTADRLRKLKARPFADWLPAQPKHVETDDERLARLAALLPLQYDRVRKAEAAAAGVQLRALDDAVKQYRGEFTADTDDPPDFLIDPEPWSEPVDGAELLNGIADAISAHVVLPRGAASAIALWVVHCHAHALFPISPILGITSPTPECGKSTLLTIISAMVPRALSASNLTASTIFRAVEKWRPTLLVDEADTFLTENHEMRGILNSGHAKAGAYVLRTVDTGKGHEPQRYCTWAPKAIAMIGKLPATLTSRAIRIELQRKRPGHNVKPLRADRLDHLTPLARQAARWVQDNTIRLGAMDPEMPPEIGNRTADNWRPLIAIADVAGGEWPERAREIAKGDRMPVQELGIMLLEDIQKIFADENSDRISSANLANKLVLEEDRPWVEYHYDKPITPRQIAELLEPFKIAPHNIAVGTTRPKGYLLQDFKYAFATYTPDFAATPLLRQKSAENDEKKSATGYSTVADKNAQKPAENRESSGVAAETPSPGDHTQNPAPKANGHHVCTHCAGGEKPDARLIKSMIPGRNQHGWVHNKCLVELTRQHRQEASS